MISTLSLFAQNVTSIVASSEDISDNLDLEAVASVFGESKDLEDFEKRLNDPKTQISNLDLNNDGEVDYLRVVETTDGSIHTISIQSIIAKDQYQEVAVIVIEKDTKGETQVQVVGNLDIYGPNYYVIPVYPVVPVFFTFFWIVPYHPWYSPWYWGYHPPYFRPWRPYPAYRYRANVHVHINVHNTYHRTNVGIDSRNRLSNTKNNAYFKNNPDKSFKKRNPGVNNRNELNNNRKSKNIQKDYKSTGRAVKSTTKPTNKSTKNPTSTKSGNNLTNNQKTKSNRKPPQQPSTSPSNNSYSRPSTPMPSHSYSRQAPSRSNIRRTRH